MLGLHALLLVGIIFTTSPVMDELPHLAAGIVHWKHRTFEPYRVNPPLVRSLAALPVLAAGVSSNSLSDWPHGPFERPEFDLGRALMEENGSRSILLFRLARLACVPV